MPAKPKSRAKARRPAKRSPATKKRRAAAKKPAPRSRSRIKSVIAVANLQPPKPYEFYVRAIVTVPTPGYRAHLKPAVPQGINPRILILDVVLEKLPGIWPQVETDIEAAYRDNNYQGDYRQVTVRYENESKTVDVQIVV
jgi:hypothetical protein